MAENMVPPSGKSYSKNNFSSHFFILFQYILFREKNKKWAEQGAALVCLYFLGIIDKQSLTAGGNILS